LSFAYAGTQGNVLSGATDVDMSKWEIKHGVNTFDSTTTADDGWDSTTASTMKLGGSFTFFYNPAKFPYGSLNLAPGSTPTLKLFINETSGNFFTGVALITDLSFAVAVKEGIPVTASFVNKGPWTLPTT
jgi:hypothetical protein